MSSHKLLVDFTHPFMIRLPAITHLRCFFMIFLGIICLDQRLQLFHYGFFLLLQLLRLLIGRRAFQHIIFQITLHQSDLHGARFDPKVCHIRVIHTHPPSSQAKRSCRRLRYPSPETEFSLFHRHRIFAPNSQTIRIIQIQ